MKFRKMEKFDFAKFLWKNLELGISYEFGDKYDPEKDACKDMYCIKKVLIPGTMVIVCDRLNGGAPFAFDIHTANFGAALAGFYADFWEYLTEQGFSKNVWVNTEPEHVAEDHLRHFHKKDRASFMTMVINSVSYGQDFEIYAEEKKEHYYLKRIAIGRVALLVAVSCHGSDEVFSFEVDPKNISGIYDRFYSQFGAYLNRHGFSDTVMYRRCN